MKNITWIIDHETGLLTMEGKFIDNDINELNRNINFNMHQEFKDYVHEKSRFAYYTGDFGGDEVCYGSSSCKIPADLKNKINFNDFITAMKKCFPEHDFQEKGKSEAAELPHTANPADQSFSRLSWYKGFGGNSVYTSYLESADIKEILAKVHTIFAQTDLSASPVGGNSYEPSYPLKGDGLKAEIKYEQAGFYIGNARIEITGSVGKIENVLGVKAEKPKRLSSQPTSQGRIC